MACPLCGERCTCSYASQASRVSAPRSLTYEYESGEAEGSTGAEPMSAEHAAETTYAVRGCASPEANESRPIAPPEDMEVESTPPPTADSMWKQEIASRLENYRARRGTRRPRFNGTLSLDFDRAANRMMALSEEPEPQNEFFGASSAALADEAAPPAFEDSSAVETEPQPSTPPPAPRTQSPEPKIIEFPRLPSLFDPQSSGNEVAEPLLDKPRILLVPEEVPTAIAPLADIQLEPEETSRVDELDLPLRVAPMGQRLLAGCADTLIVLVAAGIFMAVALHFIPAPDTRIGYALLAVLPLTLWAMYEYLFLVNCAVTPGMQMAQLSLASFDSQIIGKSTRRARALACMLSAFPLGLGLIWAFLDDDTLCWHDRITRTYLVHSEACE